MNIFVNLTNGLNASPGISFSTSIALSESEFIVRLIFTLRSRLSASTRQYHRMNWHQQHTFQRSRYLASIPLKFLLLLGLSLIATLKSPTIFVFAMSTEKTRQGSSPRTQQLRLSISDIFWGQGCGSNKKRISSESGSPSPRASPIPYLIEVR